MKLAWPGAFLSCNGEAALIDRIPHGYTNSLNYVAATMYAVLEVQPYAGSTLQQAGKTRPFLREPSWPWSAGHRALQSICSLCNPALAVLVERPLLREP